MLSHTRQLRRTSLARATRARISASSSKKYLSRNFAVTVAPGHEPFAEDGGFLHQTPKKKRWKADEIWSVNHTRVNGNTTRDGHQSLIGGQHRIEHLEKAAALLDKVRSPDLQFPGVEECGGGTTVDFPLRYKGENPFDNIRRICNNMPNTPAMCLTRSDSIVGYSTNAKDVVESFVRLYHQAGIDVFRNFDAYNNWQNHVNISEAVHKVGAHYQGAITFTTHEDPTLYNIKWVRDMTTELVRLGAHSICVKDMSGIASPKMMKAWVREIRETAPELPLVIHSHYTTGFSPITYLEAIREGATAIDCAISTLSGRTGHPSMEVMAKVLEDEGFEHGLITENLQPVSDFYREINPLYKPFEPEMAGSCDYRVFLKGIPGGQISIFKNELEKNQIGHLFDHVMDTIQECRDVVGGVALVTPTADNVARQQTVNAISEEKGQEEYSQFWSGYNEMLRGALGQPKQPMDSDLQNKALLEWTKTECKNLVTEGVIDEDTGKELTDGGALQDLQKSLWEISLPVQQRLRLEEVQARIKQLEAHSDQQREEVNQQIIKLNGAHGLGKDLESSIQNLKDEVEQIKKDLAGGAISDDDYLGIMTADMNDATFSEITSKNPKLKNLSKDAVNRLARAAAFISVPPSTVIPETLPQARIEVEALAQEHGFKIPAEGTDAYEEWAVLYAIFKYTQDIALNYFKNVAENMAFWPSCPGTEYTVVEPPPKPASVMFPFMTKNVDSVAEPLVTEWSDAQIERITKVELDQLQTNIDRQERVRNVLSNTKSDVRKSMLEDELKELSVEEQSLREEVKATLRRASLGIPRPNLELDAEKSLTVLVEKFNTIVQNGNGKKIEQ